MKKMPQKEKDSYLKEFEADDILYKKNIKSILVRDKTPYKDIVFVEAEFKKIEKNVTIDEFYERISDKMDRETFDAIINYLLETTRLYTTEVDDILVCSWNPIDVEVTLKNGIELYA